MSKTDLSDLSKAELDIQLRRIIDQYNIFKGKVKKAVLQRQTVQSEARIIRFARLMVASEVALQDLIDEINRRENPIVTVTDREKIDYSNDDIEYVERVSKRPDYRGIGL